VNRGDRMSDLINGLSRVDVEAEDFTAYQASKRRRKIWLIVLPALVILAGVLIWLVWFSSVFAVKEVQVVDSAGQILSADQIAQVQGAANIPLNQPIARLDTDTAAQAVANLPWVSSVEVRRGWPNEVVVALDLRIPLARVKGPGPSQGVDAQGIVFDSLNLAGLPLIEATGAPLISAVEVVVNLPENLAQKVVRIRAESIDSIELDLKSGSIVRWGSADEPEFKAAVLDALLLRRAQIYDVSAPELPTTTDEKGPKKA
jgi:cell division protein FtsQ